MTALEIALAIAVAILAVLFFRHQREFGKLRRWASQTRLSGPPEAAGAWGKVFNLLHRHRHD